jgi:small subunit ribosomal protein S9
MFLVTETKRKKEYFVYMEILARGVGRRKESVAQAIFISGTGQIIINDKPASQYLQNNTFSLLAIGAPSFATLELESEGTQSPDSQELLLTDGESQGDPKTSKFFSIPLNEIDTIIKVKGGGIAGQTEAIRLAVARALCQFDQTAENSIRKTLRTCGFLTQDSRIKERRKYGLKKARKASQYHKR